MKKYTVQVLCSDCKEKLLESVEMNEHELRSKWSGLVMSAPLNTPSCDKGCRATFSDCNANTDMEIYDVTEKKIIENRTEFLNN